MNSFLHTTSIPVCGHPKSGTTLLAALLDGHPEIVVFPEETFFLNQLRKRPHETISGWKEWLLAGRGATNLSQGAVETALDGNFDYSGFDYDSFAAQFRQKLPDNARQCQVLPALIGAYAQVTAQLGKQFWLEKTPGNEYSLDKLVDWYGVVRPIYILRDPRDVYVSYAKKKAKESAELPVEDFICRWGLSLAAWQRFVQQHNTGLLVRFEDLVSNSAATMNQICAYLEIENDPALQQPTKNGVLWHGNSMHGDRFATIDDRPVGRWQTALSQKDSQAIEKYLGKAMVQFGYTLQSKSASWPAVGIDWVGRTRRRKRLFGTVLGLYASDYLPQQWANRLAP